VAFFNPAAQSRLLWTAILAIGLTALYCGIARPQVSAIPKRISDPLAEIRPTMPPPPEIPALEIPASPALVPPPLPSLSPVLPVPLPPTAVAAEPPFAGKK
jgi:hypothetical protein